MIAKLFLGLIAMSSLLLAGLDYHQGDHAWMGLELSIAVISIVLMVEE